MVRLPVAGDDAVEVRSSAVLVTVSVLFGPFERDAAGRVNSSGLLPPRVTVALLKVTALVSRPPVSGGLEACR